MVALTQENTSTLPRDVFLYPKQNKGFQIPYFLSSEEELSKVRPPAVVKTLEQRLQELSEKELGKLNSFRAMVQEAAWYSEELDDWMLIRYLQARHFDLKKSLHMLEKTVLWRKKNDAQNWTCEMCQTNPDHHMMQFVGWDLLHRPVCFMSMRWGPERKEPLQHCIAAFNHLERLMPVGVEQWVCLTDFATYSHLRDSNPKIGSTVINIIQDHYPERLGMMFLVNAPTAFGVLWKMLSFVIDSKTKEKVQFVYSKSKPRMATEFAKLFPTPLCEYLCESYRRSEKNIEPALPIWWSASSECDSNSVNENGVSPVSNK